MTRQSGFTLVELAIVLIIIGLLIGGILKGQELIGNARVTSTISQINAINAAALTFQDTYNAMPGDFAALNRLPGCTAAPCASGDGSGRLNNTPGVAMGSNEGGLFFYHLNLADLLDSGAPTGNGTPADYTIGQGLLGAKIGRGISFRAGYASAVADLVHAEPGNDFRAGHYLTIAADDDSAIPPINNNPHPTLALIPSEAMRIDQKYDDGLANVGSIVGVGNNGSTLCTTGSSPTALYQTTRSAPRCALYIRIMQ